MATLKAEKPARKGPKTRKAARKGPGAKKVTSKPLRLISSNRAGCLLGCLRTGDPVRDAILVAVIDEMRGWSLVALSMVAISLTHIRLKPDDEETDCDSSN